MTEADRLERIECKLDNALEFINGNGKAGAKERLALLEAAHIESKQTRQIALAAVIGVVLQLVVAVGTWVIGTVAKN
jgi:hypothetical protein